MLPFVLLQLGETLEAKGYKMTFRVVKPIIILLCWAFPYMLGAIPFFHYFHEDKSEVLKKNGFDGHDWS